MKKYTVHVGFRAVADLEIVAKSKSEAMDIARVTDIPNDELEWVDSDYDVIDEHEASSDEEMLYYVKSQIPAKDMARGWSAIANREPIPSDLADKIYDLCEEWCEDNDLAEGAWLDTFDGEEDVFRQM